MYVFLLKGSVLIYTYVCLPLEELCLLFDIQKHTYVRLPLRGLCLDIYIYGAHMYACLQKTSVLIYTCNP